MRKTKQPNKKLTLAKETLLELGEKDLPKAAGGTSIVVVETNTLDTQC